MEIDVKCPDVLKKCCKMVSPYSCILNKYDPIDKSNQCRRLQLLNRNNEAYFLYQCWGKIDAVRKESIDCYLDLSAAEDAFYAEFYTHTGIQWSERLLTASRPDYYSFVLMNFNIEENEENTIYQIYESSEIIKNNLKNYNKRESKLRLKKKLSTYHRKIYQKIFKI